MTLYQHQRGLFLNILKESSKKTVISVGLFLIFTFQINAQFSTCATSLCAPIFQSKSALPDSAFYNCDISKVLDPKLDKSGKIIYMWRRPDDSVFSASSIIATMPGKYVLCYDTAGPFSGTCPKSDTVIVTRFTKQIADAGDDFVVCSGVQKDIGRNTTDITKYSYRWIPGSAYLIGADVNKNNPKFVYRNLSPTIAPSVLVLEKTELATGCKDNDTVSFKVIPLPNLRIEKLKTSYCAGEVSEIDLVAYATDLNFKTINFTINSTPQTLPASRTEGVKHKNYGLRYENTPYPTKLYTVQFPAETAGLNKLKLTVTTSEGCTFTIDSNKVLVNAPNSNIEIKGLNSTATYCSKEDNPVGLLALKEGQPSSLGAFASAPNTGAISGDATSGYFFTPAKASIGVNIITYTEPKIGTSCGASGSVNVNISPAPVPKIVGRTSVCPGALSAEYRDTASLGANVIKTWQPEPGNAIISETKTAATINWQGAAGITTLKVVNADGACSADTVITVSINKTLKSQSPQGEKALCTGPDSTLYNAESGSRYLHKWFIIGGDLNRKFLSYSDAEQVKVKWNPGQSTYWLWVRDSSTFDNTCFGNSDTLKIKFISDPFANILTANNASACKGQPFELKADPAGGDEFVWSPGNISGATISIPKADTTQRFILTVRKGVTCPEKSDTVTVVVHPVPPNPLPMPDFQMCFEDNNDTIIRALKGDPANRLVWNNDPSSNTDNLLVTAAGTYSVVQTNAFGCTSEGSINILDNCPTEVYIAQAFSPNNDGINDSLRVYGSNFMNLDLKIYNRWGEVVFTTNKNNFAWDGKYNGLQLPAGVYPWVVTYETDIIKRGANQVITRKGSVALVR